MDAAAVLFKGITAQYLLKSTYPVGPGTIIVLYGVAGGVGQIMTRWAKHLRAFVIGIVSKQDSVALAETLGCDAVFVFNAETLAAGVAKITNGKKADVVYDPIGKVSFNASLDSLRPRGLLVSFGASSGAPPAIEVGTLNAKGSLFLTRPSIADGGGIPRAGEAFLPCPADLDLGEEVAAAPLYCGGRGSARFNPDANTVIIRKSKSGKVCHVILTPEGANFFHEHCAGREGTEAMFRWADGSDWNKSDQVARGSPRCGAAHGS